MIRYGAAPLRLTALFLGAVSAAFAVARRMDTADVPAPRTITEARVLELDIGFFQARVQRDSLSARDFAELARLYLQRARLDAREEDLRRAEAAARRSLGLRQQRNAESFQVLASSLMGQHRFAEARVAAERLVGLDSSSRASRAILGEIQLELGAYDDAARTFGTLFLYRGELAVAPRYARWEEIRGRPEEARHLLRAARDQARRRHGMPAGQLAWFHWRLGDLALRQGHAREATSELEAGLAIAPADHRLLDALARTAAARGDWSDAVAYGERAITTSLDPATLGLLYQAHTAQGDTAKAEDYWRALSVTALAAPGGFHRQWGLLLLDRGQQVDSVLARARREVETRPDVYGWDLLAWSLYRAGRPAEARAPMRRALAVGTRDAQLFYHAGMIELALANRAEARRCLAKAIEINPRWDPFHADEAKRMLRELERTA